MKEKKSIDLETLRGKIFTTEGVAAVLGMNPESIRRKIRAGQLPARTIPGGQGYTIIGAELADYLQGIPVIRSKRAIEKPKAHPLPLHHPGDDFYKLPLTANRRFKEWFNAQGVMIKTVAEVTGLGGDKLSRILNGKRAITRATLEKLEAAYGKGLTAFLITGERS